MQRGIDDGRRRRVRDMLISFGRARESGREMEFVNGT